MEKTKLSEEPYGTEAEGVQQEDEVINGDSPPKLEEVIAQADITTASTPPIEDIITEDGILGLILSKLTLREAVGTCLLSPRWRYLWMRLPKLRFNVSNVLDAHTASLIIPRGKPTPLTMDEKLQLLERKTDQFVQFVDFVMQHHQGSGGVEEFVVRYFLREAHFHRLDAWIRAGFSSKTKVLGLQLNKPYCLDVSGAKYEFHFPQLQSPSSLEELVLLGCFLKLPSQFYGLNHLKILKLVNIDVTEEDITRLLSNCYTLEYLRIYGAKRIVTLSVPHPQIRLQCLLVNYCDQCRKIKVDAITLVNLVYEGYPVEFLLGQDSQLINAAINFKVEYMALETNLGYYLSNISTNLPHLRSLSFKIVDKFEVPDISMGSNKFSHLKQLNWSWNAAVKMSLSHLTTLLDACPFLEDFKLRLRTECTFEQPPQRLRKLWKMLPKNSHTHLKNIWIFNFLCDKWRIEFAAYLLKNATELKSMTLINVSSGIDEGHINTLRQRVPAKVKFVVSSKVKFVVS